MKQTTKTLIRQAHKVLSELAPNGIQDVEFAFSNQLSPSQLADMDADEDVAYIVFTVREKGDGIKFTSQEFESDGKEEKEADNAGEMEHRPPCKSLYSHGGVY